MIVLHAGQHLLAARRKTQRRRQEEDSAWQEAVAEQQAQREQAEHDREAIGRLSGLRHSDQWRRFVEQARSAGSGGAGEILGMGTGKGSGMRGWLNN